MLRLESTLADMHDVGKALETDSCTAVVLRNRDDAATREFPPIALILCAPFCCCGFPGPVELGAINPDAVHDGQSKDRKGARPQRSLDAARPRRRGD